MLVEQETTAVTADAVVARLDRLAGETARRDGGFDRHGLLGPDLFGLRAPLPATDQTRGVDHARSGAAAGMALLDRLDLARPPRSRPAGPRLVVRSEWPAEELARWAVLGFEPGTLPRRREVPLLLHGIWLGGPLRSGGVTGKFRTRFAASARVLGGQTVLWTDVPRSRVADHADLVNWARRNDIRLVNVDEVFTDAQPMWLDPYFRAETHTMSPRGFAAASDILRMEVLHRFGGLYTDGDDHLEDPDVLARLARAPDGFAVCGVDIAAEAGTRPAYGNSAVAMAKGHPFALAYLEQLRGNYGRTVLNLFPREVVVEPRDAFDRPDGRMRRHEVRYRTGPANFTALRVRVGMEVLPRLTGVLVGSANSWLGGPTAGEPPVPADDLDATVALTARVVATLVRQLHNRQGDLHLTEAADAVHRHADPDLVWTAALSFIAGVPALRTMVTTATAVRFENGTADRVRLPFTARRLLRARDGAPAEFLAEVVAPVRMTALDRDIPFELRGIFRPASDLAAEVLRRAAVTRRRR